MLKVVALQQIEDLIVSCGYSSNSIKRDYRFITNEKSNYMTVADMAVFSDYNRSDISTSCISVNWVEDDKDFETHLNKNKFLVTPLIILPSSRKVRFYDLRSEEPKPHDVSYELLEKHFSVNRLSYSKPSLERAKNSDTLQQLSLFAVDATRELLVRQFELAVKNEIVKLDKKYYSDIVKVAIHVLAACIIGDKLWVSEKQPLTVNELISKCAKAFPKYFKNVLNTTIRVEIAEKVYKCIRTQLTFQALTNDILGYFYEYAILSPEVKESLGIFWTDEALAKKICDSIPFENIPLDDMRVLDGTCGSGSLLISSCKRLEGLLPARMSGQAKHNWLTDHISGVEIEQLSAEIAKLSLLLYSLPYGNNWDIINCDFMKLDLAQNPNVIIANPPFKESKTEEMASQFLIKYIKILSPGGIMGIILPVSFLESEKCIASRKMLLESSRLLEIWYLPESAFRTSSIATVVLILIKDSEKKVSKKYPVKIIEIDRTNLVNFYNGENTGAVSFVDSDQWYSDSKYRIVASSLDNVLDQIHTQMVIDDVVNVRQGIIPCANSEDFSNLPIRNEGQGGKWLQSPHDNILEPYKINWKNYKDHNRLYTKYPGDHHRPRRTIPFEKPKIVVNSVRNSSTSWRIYGALDKEGYYVSQSFFVLFLKKDLTVSLEEVLSIINHPLASLFISKYNRRSYIQKGNIGSIPFPEFSKEQKEAVVSIVNNLISFKLNEDNDSSAEVCKLITTLDDIVYDAYKIPIDIRGKIKAYMRGDSRPGSEWRYSVQRNVQQVVLRRKPKTWKVFGQIEEIELKESLLTFFVQGQETLIKIPIPNSLPGWALEPGVTFEAEIPFDQRYESDLNKCCFINFRLLNYRYLSEEELNAKTFEPTGLSLNGM